jgi:hypothetical protein
MSRARLVSLLLLGCSTEPQAVSPAATAPARADITLKNVTVRQYRGADLRVVATSPVVELQRGTNEFGAADAGVYLRRSNVTVLSQRIAGNAVAQVATGSGGVLFVGNDGAIGRTETATYDRALGTEGAAVCDAGVVMEHPRFDLTATGFFADFAEQRVSFDQPVTHTRP